MSFFKKILSTSEPTEGGGDSSMFDVTLDQLKELMSLRGKEFTEKLNSSDYNGVNGILEKLKVDRNTGLDSNNQQDLEQRRTAYGKNIMQRVHIPLTLSPHKSDEIGGVAILVVIFVTAFSDWIIKWEFHRVQDEMDNKRISVVRDNRIQEIVITELVVGDLYVIKSGDRLPADGLVIEGSDLKVDESFTIEEGANLAKKNENDDVVLFADSKVMEGSGRMVVVAVGVHTQEGISFNLLLNTKYDFDDNKEEEKN